MEVEGTSIDLATYSKGPYGPIKRVTIPKSLSVPFPIRMKKASKLKKDKPGWKIDKGLSKHLETCSIIVGLHPDQPTEAIIDFGLSTGTPVAVVPCCVFPNLFPERRFLRKHTNSELKTIKLFPFQRRTNKAGIRTYEDFCAYLLSKSPRLKCARLDMEGRNVVIYLPPGASKADRSDAVSTASPKFWLPAMSSTIE